MARPIRFLFAILTTLALSLGACVEGSSRMSKDTRITPDVFQYATIIEAPNDGSTGGWRAVCIKHLVKQGSASSQGAARKRMVECGLEFGSPIVNRQHGHIPLRMAQRVSAEVANEVGRRVLEKARGFTSTTCRTLIDEMNEGMNAAINGSTVTQCGVTQWSDQVPEVIWPPPE